jgi:hypothetical protein
MYACGTALAGQMYACQYICGLSAAGCNFMYVGANACARTRMRAGVRTFARMRVCL